MKTHNSLLGSANRKRLLLPFILVTSLFFFWGFAHSLLDVLNKHFQEILDVTRAESGLVQFSVYGGYFLAALPAGYFMNRFGYKRGIVTGLLLYALGAFAFLPAAHIQAFWPFLTALMIIAFGLAFLETAANPYIAVLGPRKSAERRLNFSQSFNGLGWIFGPLVGGLLIFGMTSEDDNAFTTLTWPYLGIGCMVLLVALLFVRTPLPETEEQAGEMHEQDTAIQSTRSLWSHKHFMMAVMAQFFYVAAQTGINSFFINYVTESILTISNEVAAIILSFGGMGLFWIGRLSGSALMRSVKPNRLLSVYAAMCMLMMVLVVAGLGWISIVALFTTYFFMSIMFPTIFVLGLNGLGVLTKKASSYLVMAIVGGALAPLLMGYIADVSAMQWGYLVPLVCFAVVYCFGRWGWRVR